MVNLADGFVAHAKANPTRLAFVLGNTKLSYQALLDQSDRWLAYLQALFESPSASREPTRPQNLVPNRLVAWEGANHSHLPALYLACLRSGCCLVLLDPAWPAERTASVCRNLGLNHCINADTDPGLKTDQGAARSDTGALHHCFLLGFTSGSTGFPKAFVRTQQSWLATFAASRDEFRNAASGRVLAPGPLSHGLSFFALAETLNAGGTFYSQARFDPRRVVAEMREEAINVLVAVPTMLVAMLNTQTETASGTAPGTEVSSNLSTSLRILSAGAKLEPSVHRALARRWPGVKISEYYGASELSFVSVAHAADNAPPESVGRAFTGVSISIRDEQGRPLPAGKSGTVWAESEMLALGTIETGTIDTDVKSIDRGLQLLGQVAANGRQRATVGDIGKLDKQGYLYLLDRAHNMILSGGLNVSPRAVETVLLKHPAISGCVAIGLADSYWGERVCAVLQLSATAQLSSSEFDDYCKDSLAAEQIPRQVLTTDCFPMTSSGKLARAALKQQLETQPDQFGQLDA